ncbi:amino acid permease [Niallia taxi]|uniref:amino acid permease n=1 Tax=Niallia taxi TaxID=2499688 RepID=UPI0015F37BD3|nr:amino acid permease [Niallia taxi]MED4036700.1 amino acid permease [Niallia taxi]MED4053484.1 amino acid permease [Niallia taxi]MED4119324.1 amino acid permease [Niallia taxi]
MSSQDNNNQKSSKKQGKMKWWELSLVGVGCTIGTGYFVGSSLGVIETGPAIVLSFMIAAIGTYIVFNLLAKMTAEDPQEGSFCYYANKAFGSWAGFSCGWNYWGSNILIMGSQLTALSLLSQFWFPNVPLWVFACIYAVLSIFVVFLGTDGFDKVENYLAVIKTAAIIMFIILGAAALFGWIHGGDHPMQTPKSFDAFFPKGFQGFWTSLIYAFYAYGGIEVIGLMAMQLKDKKDAPKAGTNMLIILLIIYCLSLAIAVLLVPLDKFNEKESPFVTALAGYPLSFFPHVFNGAIIIAGFSTMTASLFGVTNLLVTLAKSKDAPAIFEKKLKKFHQLPLPSLILGAVGLFASVLAALLLPGKIFEYITTAAGILLLYNWAFILFSSFKVLKPSGWDKTKAIIGIALIVAAVSGTVMEKGIRIGFFVSLACVALIGVATFIMHLRQKKSEPESA